MPERPPPMQHKVDMKKVIDLSKLSLDKLKSLFKKSDKNARKVISRHIAVCHTAYGKQMKMTKQRRKRNRYNEIAKEARRKNRRNKG